MTVPVSPSPSERLTAAQMVQAAAEELGVVGIGEDLEPEESEFGIRQLQWMLKSLTAKGVNLWTQIEETAVFAAGTRTVTLDPYVIDILEARFVQSAAFERPLQRWENGQYFQLPNKAQSGYPVAYNLQRSADLISMSLWPVPVADSTIIYTAARTAVDISDPNQIVDIPAQWSEAIYLALAARMAPTFGVTRTDPNTVATVTARAAALEQLMLDQDRPASMFAGPWNERYF